MSTGGNADVLASIGLDASQFGAGADEVARYLRRIEDEQRKTDRAIEDSTRRRARLDQELAQQIAEGRLDAARRTGRQIEALEQQLSRAAEASAQRQARAAEDLARAQERAARRAADAQEREARRAADQQERAARRSAEAQEREARRAADARRREAERAEQAERAATDRGLDRMTSSALGAAAAITGIGGAIDGLQLYAEGLADMARDMERLARASVGMRDATAETGSVLGVYGNELNELILRFQAESTLESPQRSEEFLRSFKSAMEIPLLRGQISDADFQTLQVRGGQLAAAEGFPAGPFADLMGTIATQTEGELDPDTLLAQTSTAIRTLYAGVGDLKLLPQLIRFAGAQVDPTGNLLKDVNEAAGIVAISSLGGAEEAGMNAAALFKTVMAGSVRQRNVSGAEMTQSEFLRGELGIESTDDPVTRYRKLFSGLIERQDAGIPINETLTRLGFGNENEKEAVTKMMKNFRRGDFDLIQAEVDAALAAGPVDVQTAIARRLGEDAAAASQAGAMGELARQRMGAQALPLEVMADFFMAARPAEARGPFKRFVDQVGGTATGRTDEEAYRDEMRNRALDVLRLSVMERGLESEAEAAIGGGYDIEPSFAKYPRLAGRREGLTPQMETVALIQTLRDAGVDPTLIANQVAGAMPGPAGAGTAVGAQEQLREAEKTNALLQQMIDAIRGAGAAGPPPLGPPGGLND